MKIQFIKSAAGFAYSAGMQADLPEEVVKPLIEQGFAFPIEQLKEPESDLPEDFPAREILIKEGLVTMADVMAAKETLTDIKGIGEKTKAEIVERLTE